MSSGVKLDDEASNDGIRGGRVPLESGDGTVLDSGLHQEERNTSVWVR
jgi:hypothetical protein